MIQNFHLNDKNVKEMCKYASISHTLVTVPMNHLDVYELNLLFGIYSLLGYGMTDISLTESAIRELAKPNNTMRLTKKQGEQIAKSLIVKMKGCGDPDYVELFDVFQCDYEDNLNKSFDGMRIKIWNDCKDIFTQHSNYPYTLVKLKEFKSLRSTQAKIFYLLMAQWKSVGMARFKEEDLLRILGTPNKAQLKVLVDNLVVKLRDCFKGLNVRTKQNVGQHGKHKNKVYIFGFQRKSKQTIKKVSD